ncbi:MAG: tRNA uridine(34) 5-carboxymethylaminomethyl modification radical SAM/GNAT enzyme Elp3 [Acidobacteriota bacterium]
MRTAAYHFDPFHHETELVGVIDAIRALDAAPDTRTLNRILRRFPKAGVGAFSKSEIIRGYRALAPRHGWKEEAAFVARLRMKPIRTMSGVAPVTVLTKPFPCPGKCIFCPNDVRMPKSYLSREPGAQRAAQFRFDPYGQTLGRLLAFHVNGHPVDKVEMIILGGTWSFYPESYQVWFIERCFAAMNDFDRVREEIDRGGASFPRYTGPIDFDELEEDVDGRTLDRSYNEVVGRFLRQQQNGRLTSDDESATWAELEAAHRVNETARARCVGLVVETRPDHLDEDEVRRIRRLGCTKVQIGYQSLSDEVLAANNRGHDVAATRRAMTLLRSAGFKIHAHWMPNLHGSDPVRDVEDFQRIFGEPDFRPDELKIYPCSLIESAELMAYFQDGRWRPYSHDELLGVLEPCLLAVPPYCRVTRIIRDIPGDDIFTGNKVTNFRQVVEASLTAKGLASQDIRAREIRGQAIDPDRLRLEPLEYDTQIGREVFFRWLDDEDRLCGFLRLSLPSAPIFLDEIRDSAMIREVHVYGRVAGFEAGPDDGRPRSQHRGLGRRLVDAAVARATADGYRDLAVIAAIGTRDYYRGLGFVDGALYQHRRLDPPSPDA